MIINALVLISKTLGKKIGYFYEGLESIVEITLL